MDSIYLLNSGVREVKGLRSRLLILYHPNQIFFNQRILQIILQCLLLDTMGQVTVNSFATAMALAIFFSTELTRNSSLQ